MTARRSGGWIRVAVLVGAWGGVTQAMAAEPTPAMAGAADPRFPVVGLRVIGTADQSRAMRTILSDLLAQLGIAIADARRPDTPTLADVTIDLSSNGGAPFVELAAGDPSATICRRPLDAGESRDVLLETAAQVAYTAIETRARSQGAIKSEATPVAGTASGPTQIARAADAAPALPPSTPAPRGELRVQARVPPATSYGLDAALLAETRLPGLDASRPSVGGGVAVTWAWRRRRLGPALTIGMAYQRAATATDPQAGVRAGVISVRLTPTVNALARRWMLLQLGPSLDFDLLREDDPRSFATGTPPPPTGGPPGGPGNAPNAGPIVGPTGVMPPLLGTGSSPALAICAGGFARWSIRIGRGTELFATAGLEHQVAYRGASRPTLAQGPNSGAPSSPSTWRSSVLAGVAFTIAGRPAMPGD